MMFESVGVWLAGVALVYAVIVVRNLWVWRREW